MPDLRSAVMRWTNASSSRQRCFFTAPRSPIALLLVLHARDPRRWVGGQPPHHVASQPGLRPVARGEQGIGNSCHRRQSASGNSAGLSGRPCPRKGGQKPGRGRRLGPSSSSSSSSPLRLRGGGGGAAAAAGTPTNHVSTSQDAPSGANRSATRIALQP